MKEYYDLQDPFSFTNSGNPQRNEELEKLNNPKAHGEAQKLGRQNNNKRKFIKAIALITVVTGLLATYNNAYNQTVEDKITSGEITEVSESYSPTAGPNKVYKDADGNKVNISFSDVIEDVVNSLSNEEEVMREDLIQQPIEDFGSMGDIVPSDEVLTQRLVEGVPDEYLVRFPNDGSKVPSDEEISRRR